MASYHEEVRALFVEQGFKTTPREDPSGFTAEKADETLEIYPLHIEKDDPVQQIESLADRLPESDHTRIIFTDAELDQDAQEHVEKRLQQRDIDLSHFQPTRYEQQPPDQPDNMPSSYEIIGTVAIVNLEGSQQENEDEIAGAIQEQHPNITTVLAKEDSLEGEYRVGSYRTILGSETETTHTEHGCRYRVDPTKVYFSERFGHERERVADKVQPGETVHVWFAGVGPFAILIARQKDVREVHAIEKNPDGCGYLEENIELNSVHDTVIPHCGDVRDIVPDLPPADRIIMPLPESADKFLDLAFATINDGGTIHYYRFSPEEELWEKPLQEVAAAAERSETHYKIADKEVCGHYAPYVYRVCIDITVSKKV